MKLVKPKPRIRIMFRNGEAKFAISLIEQAIYLDKLNDWNHEISK